MFFSNKNKDEMCEQNSQQDVYSFKFGYFKTAYLHFLACIEGTPLYMF